MSTKLFTLDNGIRVVYEKSQSQIAHLGVMFGVGSRDEEENCSGLVHLVEHMWFKGTKTRTGLQIVNEIENRGGDFNAYTSKEETCLHVSVLKDYFDTAINVLSDMVYNSVFLEEELLKEVEVVVDEIQSYKDSPSEFILDEFEEYLFIGNSMGRNILGSEEILRKTSSSKLAAFYKKHYVTEKLVISVVGNIPFDIFKRSVEKHFSVDSPLLLKAKFSNKAIDLRRDTFSVIKSNRTNQSHCVCGTTAYSWSDKQRTSLSLLNNIIAGPNFNSKLNIALRENKGLTYTIESVYTPCSDTGVFYVYFGVETKKVSQCYKIIKKEFDSLRSTKIKNDILQTYKNQFKGQVAISLDNMLNVMLSNAKCVLSLSNIDTYSELCAKIENVSPLNILEVANEIINFDSLSFLQYK